MSFSKFFIICVFVLFAVIGVTAWVKKQDKNKAATPAATEAQAANKNNVTNSQNYLNHSLKSDAVQAKKEDASTKSGNHSNQLPKEPVYITFSKSPLPEVDRVQELFDTGTGKLSSIVETIVYKSRVSWLNGRAAWLADYATHYATSRHFIARSLNHKPDYLTQKVTEGDQFNVFRKDKKIEFYLLVDMSSCKMFFYVIEGQDKVRTLLKTYNVGLGRLEPNSPSGSLTPLGKYSLGSKIVSYKPGSMGIFHNETTEMIRIFGTRWIPFDKEISGTTAPAKGYGIHGAPWIEGKNKELVEHVNCISKYESDGCIRLIAKDMEELFAIVVTKPTTIEIVKNFADAQMTTKEDDPQTQSQTR